MIAAKIEVVLNTTHGKAAKTAGTSREYVNRAARAGRARAHAVAHDDSAQPSFRPVLCPSATSGPTFQPSRHWRTIKAPANCAGPFKNLRCEESLAVGESLSAEHMEQCRHTEQGSPSCVRHLSASVVPDGGCRSLCTSVRVLANWVLSAKVAAHPRTLWLNTLSLTAPTARLVPP